MRRLLIATVLLGVAWGVAPAAASASCASLTPAQQWALADVVFDGTALEGPTETGVQRFRVTRYLKGSGPAVVGVQTGNRRSSGGSVVTSSVAIAPAAGERWRIFARRLAGGTLDTNACLGSQGAGDAAPKEVAGPVAYVRARSGTFSALGVYLGVPLAHRYPALTAPRLHVLRVRPRELVSIRVPFVLARSSVSRGTLVRRSARLLAWRVPARPGRVLLTARDRSGVAVRFSLRFAFR